jgi:NAD+ synthase (glutamine-hydrolysing)
MDFRSLYEHGFVRVAACTGPIAIADPPANAERVLGAARECAEDGVAVAIFPELCLTGYSIEDLLLQDAVLDGAEAALASVVAGSADLHIVIVAGVPLRLRNRVFNCAAVIHRGQLLGLAPKSYLPMYREFYEGRQIAPGAGERGTVSLLGEDVPFGPDLLFEATDLPGLVLHAEVCEDMWVPIPPSSEAALAGASVLLNLSGSPITIGRADDRKLMCQAQSSRCLAAYVYAAAGEGESSTDLSWDGQTLIFENGVLLAESERFPDGPRRSVADVDLDLLRQERMRMGSVADNGREHADRVAAFRRIRFELGPPGGDLGLKRRVERFPFVPADAERLEQDCYEAYNIQVHGLQQRLRAIGEPKVVIGVSGGLDSTHALLVCAQAMDRLKLPRKNILAYTMPGFATSQRSLEQARALMHAIGSEARELDIRPASLQMFADIEHPFARGEPVHDITFENVQAGERTSHLFRLANLHRAIVIGTGDLSELALGWCTYGVGDHMSHYAVNASVPKTLMRYVIRWIAESGQLGSGVGDVLLRIVEMPSSPELVPGAAGVSGAQPFQETESSTGPYELQDFNLYYTSRFGYSPSKVAFLAWCAWHERDAGGWPGVPEALRRAYDIGEIKRHIGSFAQKFFGSSQFKRSCIPNGPKIGSGGSLSPRGDWRAPSDGEATAWLTQLALVPDQEKDG